MEARVQHSGWVTLAGILLIVGGAFNAVWALVALGVSLGGTDPTVLGDLSEGNLEGLGIAGLVVALIEILVGVGIIRRSPGARIIALVMASIAVVGHLAYYRVLEGWAFSGAFFSLAIILILVLRREEFV